MTEDDTFDKLRRIPFDEMHRHWIKSKDPLGYRDPKVPEFFAQYGWTWEAYFDKVCD